MLLFFKLLYAQVIYSDSGTSFYWSIWGKKCLLFAKTKLLDI